MSEVADYIKKLFEGGDADENALPFMNATPSNNPTPPQYAHNFMDPEAQHSVVDLALANPNTGLKDLQSSSPVSPVRAPAPAAMGPDSSLASVPQAEEADETAPARKPAVVPQAAQPAATGDVVKDAIAKKYGFGSDMDTDAVKAAQGQASQNKMLANLGDAGDQIGYSIARIPNQRDPRFWDAMRKDANQPVQNIEELRKAKLGDLSASQQMENLDPNSPKAVMMRQQLAPLAKKVGLDPETFKNLGVQDLKDFAVGPLEFAAKLQQASETKKLQLQWMQTQKDIALSQKTTANEDTRLKELHGDEVYKKAKAQAMSADQLMNTIKEAQTNPQAAISLPAELTLFTGKGQRMHSGPLQAFQEGSPAIKARIDNLLMRSEKGTITPQAAQDLVGLISKEKEGAQAQLGALTTEYANDYKSNHGSFPRWYTPQQPGLASQRSPGGNANPPPGSIITVKGGARYKVGADGDSLEAL